MRIDDGGTGGTPVIFVHGNGANLSQWRAQLDHVRRSRRAIAFDLPGMGGAAPPSNGKYTPDAMAEHVIAVADRLKIPRFILVGHSFGSTVVAATAARYPQRVAGVVHADGGGNVKVSRQEADEFMSALRATKRDFVRQYFAPVLVNASDDVKTAVFSSVDRTGVDAFSDALESLLSFDVAKALAAYRGPTLAIAATDIESPMSFHVQFPDVPVKKMAGTSHWLMMDNPQEFNRHLDEFLAGIG